MKLTGAQILVKCLEDEGVDTVFGYPGGAVLFIYDALYDAKKLKHYLVRHEQGAAHAADGYARATGKPGVCIATSGPGATNLVTGLATAYMDSVPMVAFTGQVTNELLGRDSFQEADITGITLPITKHNYLVKDINELATVIKEAFHIASTGRPGPVLVDIAKDVSAQKTNFHYPKEVNLRGYNPHVEIDNEAVAQAAEALSQAKRPVIFIGGGVVISGAHEELLAFAEKTSCPVTHSLMGIGGFPGNHRLSMGMLGMHGTKTANYAVYECDLLLGLGVRFDDRVTGALESFAPNAKIVHVDIDPAEIGKNIGVNISIAGDVKEVLRELTVQVEAPDHSEWLAKIAGWKQDYPLRYNNKNNGKLKPQFVIEQIHEVTGGDAIITTEVGQNQMWSAQYYNFNKPRSFITSGGLGTMGYGFPAAIGAQVGRPDKVVFDIAGDGSIQMNIQELATAVHYKIPVNVAILNNHYLGMVRQWQEMFYQRRYSHTEITGPDFVKVAEAYGAVGIRVTEPGEVRPALEKAIATDNVVFLDFVVDPDENVLPMVPPGGAINKMID